MIKVLNNRLDNEQEKIVLDDSKYLLVVAGAGSGKTLTIVGKIGYLLNHKKINFDEIVCISFTRKSVLSMKDKIRQQYNLEIPVYTFHGLALKVLHDNNCHYKIANDDLLHDIIMEFFYVDIVDNKKLKKIVCRYFSKRYNDKNYWNILESKQIEQLMILLERFIRLFKCRGYRLDSFLKFKLKNIMTYKSDKCFLILAINIYLQYENYLNTNSKIDFDDIIIRATELVEKHGFNQKIKYLIVDEYQDTSLIRFNLIKTILKKTSSNFLAVGDDFQSIYRFTGCTLALFLNFQKLFPNGNVLKIQRTYRNSQELINVAGTFIMKNKCQMVKNMRSNRHLKNPIIVINYHNIKKTFNKLIKHLADKGIKEILVLGRNNCDIFQVIDKNYFELINDKLICKFSPNMKLSFLTVHKAKGLEADNVIIINLIDNMMGFPSKIIDSKQLRFVKDKEDHYLYSEERRLMYVALTRSKNYVFLLTKKGCESVFVKELIRYNGVVKFNL